MKTNKTFYLFPILLVLIIACQGNSSRQKELELRERELELREKELEENKKSILNNLSESIENTQPSYQSKTEVKNLKYIYVIFKVKEPKLNQIEGTNIPNIDGTTRTLPGLNLVTYEDHIYTSEIKEIPGYDEDKQYEYMDMIEANIRRQLSYKDMNFDNELINIQDREEREKLKEYKTKIADRKIKKFDSYKEASIYRNNSQGKFD